ncbi:hypothetical protein FB451DRAFT_1319063 [Mycena latifolia]|nr:hypothetical protein FB451DRAFT_1319063 [Mycena latifolia]
MAGAVYIRTSRHPFPFPQPLPMSSPPAPTTTAATPQMEMAALVAHLRSIAEAAAQAQAHLSNVLLSSSFIPVPSFVAGVPPTPGELAAAFPPEEEVESYWVVLRGREPGLYRTVKAAEAQTKGVPHQHMERRRGRDEALAFYGANYPDHVKKWFELPAPVPVAAAPASAPADVMSAPAAPDASADVVPASDVPAGWVDGSTEGDT